MKDMKNMQISKIIQFIRLTFMITWICWGTIVISNNFGYLKFGTPISVLLFMVGGNGAPIASYILLKRWGEIDGFKTFVKRYMNFKASLKNYILIMVLIVIHFIWPVVLTDVSVNMAVYYILLMIPFNIIGGGLEEIGWRGILQPLLEKVMTFNSATLITGFVWIVWHIPLWFIAGTYQYGSSFPMFIISVLGMAFSLALIRKVTENIFLCILFHSIINSTLAVLSFEQNYSTVITMIIEITLATLVVKMLDKKEVVDYKNI